MSILFDENQDERNIIQEEIHPMSYFKTKEFQMNNLQDQISFEKNLITGINNSKLSLYLNDYQTKQQQISEKYKEEQRYVKPEVFDTIFDDENIYGNAQQKKQQEQEEDLRKKYFEDFILKPQQVREEEEKQLVGIFNAIEKERTKPQTNHLLQVQQGWLQDLRKEVGYMKRKTDYLDKKAKNAPMCKNIGLIKKLAPTIANAMTVYFEDIYQLLIDEILTEEVYFMNEMEERGAFDLAEFEDEMFSNIPSLKQKQKQQQTQKVKFSEQKNISNQEKMKQLLQQEDTINNQSSQFQKSNQFNTSINNNSQYIDQDIYEDYDQEPQFITKERQRAQSPVKDVKRLASKQQVPIDLIDAINNLQEYIEDGDLYDEEYNEYI